MKSIPIILLASIAGFAQTYPSAEIDKLIQDAVSRDALPGAVILIGQQDRILYEKAYGNRALVPQREAMTLDTIFDCASLTKVVSTSVSIMKLVEQGKVRLNDKVTVYLPKFQGGKSDITVRLLLTHFSGLRPDLDLKPAWKGYETGIQKALELVSNGDIASKDFVNRIEPLANLLEVMRQLMSHNGHMKTAIIP